MDTIIVLERDMLIIIFDTQLGGKGMEDICELYHILVPFFL